MRRAPRPGGGFGCYRAETYSMKKFVVSIVAVSALWLTMTAGTYIVTAPADATVTTHLTASLSSASASAGQTLDIVVAAPLVVGGWVVAVQGATGQAHVVSATPAKGKKGGSIKLQFDWITAVDGQHIQLAASKGKPDALVLGAGGPSASSFPKGKDITIGTDFDLTAYVASNRSITVGSGG